VLMIRTIFIHLTEHDSIRRREPATAALYAELWLRRSVEVCWTVHQGQSLINLLWELGGGDVVWGFRFLFLKKNLQVTYMELRMVYRKTLR
jgi:hypothetical protein